MINLKNKKIIDNCTIIENYSTNWYNVNPISNENMGYCGISASLYENKDGEKCVILKAKAFSYSVNFGKSEKEDTDVILKEGGVEELENFLRKLNQLYPEDENQTLFTTLFDDNLALVSKKCPFSKKDYVYISGIHSEFDFKKGENYDSLIQPILDWGCKQELTDFIQTYETYK